MGNQEGEYGELLFNGYRVSVLQDEESWRWTSVTAAQHGCASDHCTVHLKTVKIVNFTSCVFYHNKKKMGA